MVSRGPRKHESDLSPRQEVRQRANTAAKNKGLMGQSGGSKHPKTAGGPLAGPKGTKGGKVNTTNAKVVKNATGMWEVLPQTSKGPMGHFPQGDDTGRGAAKRRKG